MTIALGLIVIAAAVVAVVRRVDVRLALTLAGFALGAVAGNVPAVFAAFIRTLCDEKFVVPICTAMGFAYVLRHSGCDQHLVRLLVEPVRRVRPLLIRLVARRFDRRRAAQSRRSGAAHGGGGRRMHVERLRRSQRAAAAGAPGRRRRRFLVAERAGGGAGTPGGGEP
jgi:hypothetical protein